MNYLGLPVFPLAAQLDAIPEYELLYDPRRVELGFGSQPAAGVQTWVKRTLTANFTGGHAERRTVEAWARDLRGRSGAFWLPALIDAGKVIAAPDLEHIIIAGQDMESAFAQAPAIHLWILRYDGSQEAAEVTSVSHLSTGDQIMLGGPLSAPLTADDLVCRLYLVRLAEDALSWAVNGNVCTGTIEAVETPTDYVAIPDLPSTVEVWMYRMVKRVTRTQLYELRLTSAPFTVTDTSSATWAPVPVEHTKLSLSTHGNEDSAELELYAFAGHPFSDWEPRHWGWPMEVYILRGTVAENGVLTVQPQTIFRGEVKDSRRNGDIWIVVLRSPLARESRVPRYAIQTRCNHVLFEPNTCRLAASSWLIAGTIAAQDNAMGTIDFDASALADKAANWLAGGRIEIGTGINTQIRSIRQVEVLTSTVHRLFLNIALTGVSGGTPVKAWPGCDRTPNACTAKFSNFNNYGGFPATPADNPAIKALELVNADISGGKK